MSALRHLRAAGISCDARRPPLPFTGEGKGEGAQRCQFRTVSVRADALHFEASALTPLTLTLSRVRERGRPTYRLASTVRSART